jgi:hypothetical protein
MTYKLENKQPLKILPSAKEFKKGAILFIYTIFYKNSSYFITLMYTTSSETDLKRD